MLLTILPGGIVLDPHDAQAQQLQARAERLGLDRVQVFRAQLVGKEQTYLVMQWPHPVFEHALPDVVAQHLDCMAHGQQAG